jgi:hypothetical protein
MRRDQLEHAIRTACQIIGRQEVIVVGSQSILGTFREDQLPNDPKHVILYTSNGEARQEFSILLTARATGGAPTRSDESSEVRWVPREDLGGYSMDRSMRLRIGHFLDGRAGPYLG